MLYDHLSIEFIINCNVMLGINNKLASICLICLQEDVDNTVVFKKLLKFVEKRDGGLGRVEEGEI